MILMAYWMHATMRRPGHISFSLSDTRAVQHGVFTAPDDPSVEERLRELGHNRLTEEEAEGIIANPPSPPAKPTPQPRAWERWTGKGPAPNAAEPPAVEPKGKPLPPPISAPTETPPTEEASESEDLDEGKEIAVRPHPRRRRGG